MFLNLNRKQGQFKIYQSEDGNDAHETYVNQSSNQEWQAA